MHAKTCRRLLAAYAFILLILAVPLIKDRVNPLYKGFPLYYGSDSSHYVVRLEQGLTEPGSDTSNGIFSIPTVPAGLQPGGLERVIGFLFSWTGWNATTVMILLSAFFAAFLIPILQRLLVKTGASEWQALAGSFFYFFLFLGPLRKFVHSSWSLPLAMSAVLLVWRFWEKPSVWRAVLAGIVVGCLPHVYYWGWTFVWCFMGLLTLFMLFNRSLRHDHFWKFVCLWLATFVVAAPYFLHIVSLMSDPFAHETAERSSVVFARGVESIPRSILTFFLALSAVLFLYRKRAEESLRFVPIAALCVTSFIVLHQQYIHGQVISFSTHYYPYICIAALVFASVLLVHRRWSLLNVGAFLLCSVFLSAALVDYSGRHTFFMTDPNRYHFQHFSTLTPVLDADPTKEVILSDFLASLAIAGATKHDVVFTEHERHLLISTQEYAERYCLSELFEPISHPEWVPDTLDELSRLGRARAVELHNERLARTVDACRRVRGNPLQYLKHYGVTLLVWDEKDRPGWKIDPKLFRLEQRGEGWSLWRLRGM